MANKNVPQGGKVEACENAGKAEQAGDPIKTLEFVDGLVQEATDAISALATAAQKMLALDASSLETVSQLLTQIHALASDVKNHVNCEAEIFGANYRDDSRSDWRRGIWAQHHALHRTNQVGAA